MNSNQRHFPPAPLKVLNYLLAAAVMAVLAAMGLLVLKATPVLAAGAADKERGASSASATAQAEKSAEIAPFFTPEVQHWRHKIARWAEQYGLDPNLIAVVMQIESCGNPRAVSGAGALGLFQVMPFHFAAGENAFDPDTNARRGLGYLKAAMERAHGEVSLALAGYNGGLGVIGAPRSAWPAETRRYVAWAAPIYRDAAAGKKKSTALQKWYNLSGRWMCARAQAELKK